MDKITTLTKNTFQCHHNNKGFCKFGVECHFQHYHEICSKKVCREKECKARHPKCCKNGDACKFYKKKVCAYRHDIDDLKAMEVIKNQNLTKEITALEKQVEKLQSEVINLNEDVKVKEQKLEELSNTNSELSEELSKENKNLKEEIDKLRKNNEGLKTANRIINEKNANQQIKYLEVMMKNEDLTKLVEKANFKQSTKSNFECNNCEKYFLNKVQLEEHKKMHCNICGEIFQSILHLKKHENNSGHY